ncbi:hypothetical protein [Chloroflexus sp.]|uniref:hypothetical protein n=1 Tax=Chloroflexus sp. TaxID=1904827 RepID=UPI002ACDE1AA|nr:hypothetical protein [Chloroflexus sp.]
MKNRPQSPREDEKSRLSAGADSGSGASAEVEIRLEDVEASESPLDAVAARLTAEQEAARLLGLESEPASKPAGRGKAKAKKVPPRPGPAAAAEQLAELLGVPLITAISAMILVEEARPLPEEARAFVTPIFRILIRHLPITGKLNADIVDLVAAMSALAVWLSRVRPYLNLRSLSRSGERGGNPSPERPSPSRDSRLTDVLYRYVAEG